MTHREEVALAVLAWCQREGWIPTDSVRASLTALVARLVGEEMERCAKVAEERVRPRKNAGGFCIECLAWIAGTNPGESEDHNDPCMEGDRERFPSGSIAAAIRRGEGA